ncbi:inorganic phosphate transporter [Natranaeroarchaeum aerophilus]|uniref:Phosphate transporter n=1 Tax=Natranaeroarchaeum aerophilus TaxID=2917711 RepID=A0AAE3FNN6_9EURY|nr:inorganic phosphate transporter [Natranaeroarchaeum aerophilus]MCL9812311.1 inorganic phosphate transporter family protein [Natranaeroarchaeum aerophilus]
MVDAATLATLGIACLASLFMAWAIGAGSSGSTPFAPAVGANAVSVMRAGFFVGLLGFAGAVLQGANVSEAVGRELIAGDVTLSATAATLALIIAATLVAIGVFTGYPIATAFTVTGAVVGVGLAMGGDPAWAKYAEITTLWVLTPFVGGGIAYGTAKLLRNESISERYAVSVLGGLVGLILANIEFVVLGPPGEGATLAATVGASVPGPTLAGPLLVSLLVAAFAGGLLFREMGHNAERGERRFLLVMGGLVAFSAGGSQVGLAIGPLLPLLEPQGISITAILVGGGIGLLIGSWTGAPRMIKAIAQDYSSLGPRRSIAALIPSFAIAQTAVLFGIPVSFNEIIVSSIIGSGYAAGDGGVSRSKMAYTVFAWVASLVGAIVIGFGAFSVIDLLL